MPCPSRIAPGVGPKAAAVNGPVFPAEVVDEYTRLGFWDPVTVAQRLGAHAGERGPEPAFVDPTGVVLTWAEYDEQSTALAALLHDLGVGHGDCVAILLPDSPLTHVAYVAAEKAGAVAVGIGPRAAPREITHLVRETGATVFLSQQTQRGQATEPIVSALRADGLPIRHHVTVDHRQGLEVAVDGQPAKIPAVDDARDAIAGLALGANDLFFINSTSGTTGLPKCVMHTQNRWKYFHSKCRQFTPDDVFMVVVPSPFGFGLWMAHFSPTMLGARTIVVDEFDPEATLATIARERVTVLAAVTTQVLMLLRSKAIGTTDLSSLRIVQSGGERVPYEPAAEFEAITGAKILQFYGSNEAGCLCGTTLEDTQEKRLRTAGRVFPEMQVRLFDEQEHDVTARGGPGRSACKGPGITPGYFNNPAANAQLFRADGWMYLGDIVEIDEDGYLSVVGRTADFIIRGGHNVSAPLVEEEVLTHPRVAMAAVVAMPDPTLGERVCAYVVTVDRGELTVADLAAHLESRQVSKVMWPERVICVDDLPTAGGKVAKAALRTDLERRLAEELA